MRSIPETDPRPTTRLTAMPGWEGVLNQDQAWKVTTFLSHMDKLPSSVEKEWKASPAQLSH